MVEAIALVKEYGPNAALVVGLLYLARWMAVTLQPYAAEWLKGQVLLTATLRETLAKQAGTLNKQTDTLSALEQTTKDIHEIEKTQDQKLHDISQQTNGLKRDRA